MPELELCKLDQMYYISLDPEFFDFFKNFVNFRHVTDISEKFHVPSYRKMFIYMHIFLTFLEEEIVKLEPVVCVAKGQKELVECKSGRQTYRR
jgi:hypothetical protein